MKREKVLNSQLRAVAELWIKIEENPRPADLLIANYFHQYRKKFGSRDRRFISETIYSIFRNKRLFHLWLKAMGVRHHSGPFTLAVFGAYKEGLFPDSVAQALLRSQVRQGYTHSKIVKACRLILENKLPEGTKGEPLELLAMEYSMPLWLLNRWQKFFSKNELKTFVRTISKRPPLMIRTNTLKTTRKTLFEKMENLEFSVVMSNLVRAGILFEERANLFNTDEFRNGLFEVQDFGSQFVSEMIHPKGNETIWDVCAGGGGKSLALAAMMKNKGRVLATDIRPKKMQDLKKRAKRAGAFNIFPADLSRISESSIAKKGVDKVLIDAPCSGTGTLRRNPDAKWKLKNDDFDKFHDEQLKIIESSLSYLKQGGYLYYVTCSVDPRENEDVMKAAMERFALKKIDASIALKEALSPEQVKLASSVVTPQGYIRLWPHKHETDGFFLGILQKTT